MDNNEILALFDKEMRREAPVLKGRREEMPELIRHIYDDPKRKIFIVYSELTEENAEAVIERESAYFRELGRTLEWATFTHDSLPTLPASGAAPPWNHIASRGTIPPSLRPGSRKRSGAVSVSSQ